VKHPVLILAFNRAAKFEATLISVLSEGKRKIYVSQDGPRKLFPEETLATSRVIQKYLNSEDIYLANYLPSNLGTLHGVQAGISWFFSHEEKGIILEDDLILMQGALYEADYAMSFLDTSTRAASVNLRNIVPIDRILEPRLTFRYSRLSTSHGWGSTRSFWEESIKEIRNKPGVGVLVSFCRFYGLVPGLFWFSNYSLDYKLEKKTPQKANWDIRWSVSHALNGWMSIYLNRNRILYDGFGDDATLTKAIPKKLEKIYDLIDTPPLSHPTNTDIDSRADAFLTGRGYGFTLMKGLRRLLSVRTRFEKLIKLFKNTD